MKQINIVGLCLMAVCVFSAGAASSASAADLLARVAGGGSVANATFLSSAALPLLITKGGKEMHCKQATSHGLFLTSTLGKILIRFLGCSIDDISFRMKCNTSGAASGEVYLPLSTLFRLGSAHLGTSGTVPALVVLPSGTIAIDCEGNEIEMKGNVIGAFQKENGEQIELGKPLLEVNFNFQQTTPGEQRLRLILLPGSMTPTTLDLEASFLGTFELASEVANFKADLFRLSNGNLINLELVEP